MVFPLLEVDWDNEETQVHIPLIEGIREVVDMFNPQKDDPTAFNRLIEEHETREK